MAKSDFKLFVLDQTKYHLWDDFVNSSSLGTIFQLSSYFLIIQHVFNRKSLILAVEYLDKIVGGIVLYPKHRLGIQYFTLPFFIPYNGFILSEFKEFEMYEKRIRFQQYVLEVLNEYIQKMFVFGEIYVSTRIPDLRGLMWKGWNFSPDYTIKLLLQEQENLSQGIRRNQMRHIRKFENLPGKFKQFNDAKLLYNLIKQSYQYHEIKPPLTENLFVQFIDQLLERKIGRIWGIELKGKMLAGMLIIESLPYAYALFSGRDVTSERKEAEIYLYWKLLHYYKEKNFKIFDMLGAMSPSISKAKLEMGGVLKRSDKAIYFRSNFYRILFDLESRIKKKKRLI